MARAPIIALSVGLRTLGFEIRDTIGWVYGSGFPKSLDISKAIDKSKGAEKEALLWNGWGTALKPAMELIVVAMKPLGGTYAENALKWGVAGYWIDGGRIGFTSDADYQESTQKNRHGDFNSNNGIRVPTKGIYHGDNRPPVNYEPKDGRFPTNLIHDGSDEVLELFPQTGKSTGGRIGNKGSALNMMGTNYEAGDPGYGDSGSAARFFTAQRQAEANAMLGWI